MDWTKSMVQELFDVVSYIKRNRIGELLEYMANYFMEKNGKYLSSENYSMVFASNDIPINSISEGEYQLAFICEIATFYRAKLSLTKKKIKKEKHEQPFVSVYECLSYMIKYCIVGKYRIHSPRFSFDDYYITMILNDNLIGKKMEKNDNNLKCLLAAYQLLNEIRAITEEDPDLIYTLSSLVTKAQDLDLSFLETEQKRNIFKILKTKRTLYLRILILLSFEILKSQNFLKEDWLFRKIRFTKHSEFLNVISNPIIEVIIFLTSYRIQK